MRSPAATAAGTSPPPPGLAMAPGAEGAPEGGPHPPPGTSRGGPGGTVVEAAGVGVGDRTWGRGRHTTGGGGAGERAFFKKERKKERNHRHFDA